MRARFLTIAASKYIGNEGMIYAVDLWQEGTDSLSKKIADKQIRQIHTHVADVSKNIPVEDQSRDICLMATVLHDQFKEVIVSFVNMFHSPPLPDDLISRDR